MSYNYKTKHHNQKMNTLFPGGVNTFSQKLKWTPFKVTIKKWSFENEWWAELLLEYSNWLIDPAIISKLDPSIDSFMACKMGLFFEDQNIIFPSIQWQSFNDKNWEVFLVLSANTDIIKTHQDLSQLIDLYKNAKDNIQLKLIKSLWMPPHDFIFILSSLLGISLWCNSAKFLKKEKVSKLVYTKQDPRDQKLQKKFPQLKDGWEYIYRTKEQIVDYIAKLPQKTQWLVYQAFDVLQDYTNSKQKNPINDLSNETKGKLIWAMRDYRTLFSK